VSSYVVHLKGFSLDHNIVNVHFLINYVFLPHVSSLFVVYENIVRSFTHNVHLFVCCL
jgi:hypothetical protein